VLPLALACGRSEPAAVAPVPPPTKARPAAPTYVGSEACAGCHAGETERWRGSHHDLAMQAADAKTVLGDFSGVPLDHFGVPTSFAWKDGRPVVRAEGPDGVLRDFDVKYTFGVSPLQQYLAPFPDGRLQALSWAWDTRPREAGGQRWFHLHPQEQIPPGDPLHWTSVAGNWNHMCAECHSTQVKKGYDAAAERYESAAKDFDKILNSFKVTKPQPEKGAKNTK